MQVGAHEQRPGLRAPRPASSPPRSRYDEVVDALGRRRSAPFRSATRSTAATAVGPLVAERQQERVEGYIETGKAEGARVVVGGGRPAGLDKGWYVEPTCSPTSTTP